MREALSRLAMTLAVASAFLVLSKCNQGYPIAPTLCDEWCAAENPLNCDHTLDPVRCVTQCEQERRNDSAPSNGPPGRCDPLFRELVDCINALPRSAFSCSHGSMIRTPGTCSEPSLRFSNCQSRDTTTWEDVCSTWALGCTNRGDGGDPRPFLYDACIEPYRYARQSCGYEQRHFIGCLQGHELSCDAIPSLANEVCVAERSVLDGCDPRFFAVCNLWVVECASFAKDGGVDIDPSVWQRDCLMTRPVDPGPRCAREREDFYDCLTGPWYDDHVLRCDVTPVRAQECARQRSTLEACAMSSNRGDD